MSPQLSHFVREKRKPPNSVSRYENQNERRENSLDPAQIEIDKFESFVLFAVNDQTCDEIAGDDEKDIHTDKTARGIGRKCVKYEH